ncbi:MAG: ABC transporter ATP-binding protein [Rectinema subterraneum]
MTKKPAKNDYLRTILSYLSRYRMLALPGIGVMILIAMGQLAGPYILKQIIDVAVPKEDTSLLLGYAFAFVAIVSVTGALSYVGMMLLARLGLSIVTLIKQDIFSHLLKLPASFFDSHPVGELMSRTETDTERVRDMFSNLGANLIVNVLTMLGIFAVTFALVPKLALIMFCVSVTLLAVMIVFFSKIFPMYEKARSLYAGIAAKVAEFVQGIEVLKAYGRTGWAEAQLDAAAKQKVALDVRISLIEYSMMSALNALIGPLFIVALLLLYAPKVLAGTMTLGMILLFVEYGARLLRPIAEIAESLRSMQQARTSLSRIRKLMATEEEPNRGTGKAPSLQHEIRFDHVWFAYNDEDWVLRDLTFTIPKGSFAAIVGASGSGKSTTIGLICGFMHPQKGCIRIDGTPLDEIDIVAWRKKIGLVLQEAYLFPGSVLENTRLYHDEIDEKTVWSAISMVHANEAIDSLSEGLSTNLWERGGNLSSGERQLISFARALTMNPELILLDEATSNVDMATEKRIKESMEVLRKGRTMVVVAHRLSSILKANTIFFLREGRLIAQGSHESLYENLLEYRQLVDQQFPAGKGGRA